MGALILRRLALTVPTLVVVSIISFVLVRVLPGDPAARLAGPNATPENIARIHEDLGLHQPLPRQYWSYLGDVVRGDLGDSLNTGRPVTEDIRFFFPATLELTIASLLVALVLGLLLGLTAAKRANTRVDYGIRVASIVGLSIPEFLLGLILIYAFFYVVPIFPPPAGLIDPGLNEPPVITGFYTADSLLTGNWQVLWSALTYLALPALTLGLVLMAPIARLSRAIMIEVLQSDYIRAAVSYGERPFLIIWKYALRNALPPIFNMVGIIFGYLMGGAVLVETVFSRPGLGRYAVTSIASGDFASVEAFVLVITLAYVGINLVVDILSAVADPRTQY